MQRLCLAALVVLCLSWTADAAPPAPTNPPATTVQGGCSPPLSDFVKHDSFGTIKISPTGEYLAATVPLEDRTSLVILRRSDLTETGHVTLPKASHVAEFEWVSDKRLLFSISEREG